MEIYFASFLPVLIYSEILVLVQVLTKIPRQDMVVCGR